MGTRVQCSAELKRKFLVVLEPLVVLRYLQDIHKLVA